MRFFRHPYQLPTSSRFYDPEEETYDSSQVLFRTTFPRGFAPEVLQVYSGHPVTAYKFRHWGFMEGHFKGHAPTGEKVEFFGLAILELDEHCKIVKEFYCDRGELLAGFIKGKTLMNLQKRHLLAALSCLPNGIVSVSPRLYCLVYL